MTLIDVEGMLCGQDINMIIMASLVVHTGANSQAKSSLCIVRGSARAELNNEKHIKHFRNYPVDVLKNKMLGRRQMSDFMLFLFVMEK